MSLFARHTSHARNRAAKLAAGVLLACAALPAAAADEYEFSAGHPSLANWRLPDPGPVPAAEIIELGEALFFEPGLSRGGDMSCGTCHVPELGWSDGEATAIGRDGKRLRRATPTIINVAFNGFHGWDGKFESLEQQAMNPVIDPDEMNNDVDAMLSFLDGHEGYAEVYARAFPGDPEPVNEANTRIALAAFQRTIISRSTPFDRWIAGDATAMTPQQVRGFAAFVDPERGDCEVCHAAPHFTDDGFHNLGLASYGDDEPDPGRFALKPVRSMHGAFKTPTLREVARTAPYFHDGSAESLDEVVAHYVDGGIVTTNLSPNFTAARLTPQEQDDIVAFLRALSSPAPAGQPAVSRNTGQTERPGTGADHQTQGMDPR